MFNVRILPQMDTVLKVMQLPHLIVITQHIAHRKQNLIEYQHLQPAIQNDDDVDAHMHVTNLQAIAASIYNSSAAQWEAATHE